MLELDVKSSVSNFGYTPVLLQNLRHFFSTQDTENGLHKSL